VEEVLASKKEGFAQWFDHKHHISYDHDKNNFERLINQFEQRNN